MIGLCLQLQFRQEQRLELQLRAPAPPNPMKGLRGMAAADRILKKYKAVGLLIGGLAKEIWKGTTSPSVLGRHKDVDVLVLSHECKRHPGQWERGIDWWLSHSFCERPTNGTRVGLIYKVKPKPVIRLLRFGLYVCPRGLVEEVINKEQRIFGADFRVEGGKFLDNPKFIRYPVLPQWCFRYQLADRRHCRSEHCRLI